MKQKAVVMATAFTMLLAVGATGLSNEVLHQHPAYTDQSMWAQSNSVAYLELSAKLMLPSPSDNAQDD